MTFAIIIKKQSLIVNKRYDKLAPDESDSLNGIVGFEQNVCVMIFILLGENRNKKKRNHMNWDLTRIMISFFSNILPYDVNLSYSVI